MIRHRAPQDLLFDYAAGTLPEAVSLAVATHASLCEESRREVARYEALGGAMIGTIEGASLSDGALDRVLAAIEVGNRPEAAARTPVEIDDKTRDMLPAPLWPYVPGGLTALRWRRRGPNVEVAHLAHVLPGFHGGLLRIKAGRPIPVHTHRGSEYTVLLTGSYTDGGERYSRGDFQLADSNLEHQPVADTGADCLCLAVLDAPFRLTGPIGRYINPLVRI